jgi:hypothetical protein
MCARASEHSGLPLRVAFEIRIQSFAPTPSTLPAAILGHSLSAFRSAWACLSQNTAYCSTWLSAAAVLISLVGRFGISFRSVFGSHAWHFEDRRKQDDFLCVWKYWIFCYMNTSSFSRNVHSSFCTLPISSCQKSFVLHWSMRIWNVNVLDETSDCSIASQHWCLCLIDQR